MRMNSPLALLINMDGAEARLAHFTQEAERAGLSFERIAGVNGRAMSDSELQAHRDPGAIYPLAAGEIGCTLSHRRAWQRICDSGKSWGVIFEDDACLSPQTGDILAQLPEDLERPSIIKLECSNGEALRLGMKSIAFAGRSLRPLRGASIGSAAYAITRSACEILLARRAVYAVPLDLYLFSRRHGAIGGLDVFMLAPAPVIQADRREGHGNALASGITERGKRMRPRPRPSAMIKREIYRLREQMAALGSEKAIIDWR